MALTLCEVMWLKPTRMYHDNQAVLAIVADPVHHGKTKHVDIDYHFTIDKAHEV